MSFVGTSRTARLGWSGVRRVLGSPTLVRGVRDSCKGLRHGGGYADHICLATDKSREQMKAPKHARPLLVAKGKAKQGVRKLPMNTPAESRLLDGARNRPVQSAKMLDTKTRTACVH